MAEPTIPIAEPGEPLSADAAAPASGPTPWDAPRALLVGGWAATALMGVVVVGFFAL